MVNMILLVVVSARREEIPAEREGKPARREEIPVEREGKPDRRREIQWSKGKPGVKK